MNHRSRFVRVTVGALGAAALALALSGCTLITTLAGGGGDSSPTPTATPTTTSSSDAPTSAPPSPTATPPSVPTPPPTTSGSGITFTDDVAELELWLAEEYEQDYGGAPVTVTCPGSGALEVYEGMVYTCSVTEADGSTYTLTMTVTSVSSDGYSVRLQVS